MDYGSLFHPVNDMESIQTLNDRLIEHFSTNESGMPIFRIVWANDQTERKLVDFSDAGIQYLQPREMTVKKYPYLTDLYVLERLVVVPEVDRKELLTLKLSYEPIWAYRDGDGNPLHPIWSATKFIVDSLYAALGKKSLRKYVDDEKNTTPEGKEQRVNELQQELFGNETDSMDAVRYREGIVVPSKYGVE